MENNNFTLTKFRTCFGLDDEFFNDMSLDKDVFSKRHLDVKSFRKKMIKFDMEEYTDLLLYFVGKDVISVWTELIESAHNGFLEYMDYKKEITETMLFLHSRNNNNNTTATIKTARNSYTIRNLRLINEIIKGIEQEYKAHLRILGKGEIEITKDYLQNSLAEMETTSRNKPGAPKKNFINGRIAMYLSFLVRVDKFISNTKNLEDIRLTNKDCRFIYECMLFFGIVQDFSEMFAGL